MRPVYLRMTGFGPYSSIQELDFRELGQAGFLLIHGPTGSGKTSILDAICFALYGRCSGEDRPPDSVRCQYADRDTPTEVMLEFELGGERYRATRSPQYERPKQRGEGTTTQQAAALLERVTGLDVNSGTTGEVLASRVREADAEVQNLLGFSIDQFRQVMVLPQGEFRRLLYTPSNERTKILETLFRTHVYTRIQEALDKEAKALEETRKTILQKIVLLLDQAEAENTEELKNHLEQIGRELEEAEKLYKEASKKEELARKKLEAGRALDQRFAEEQEARVFLAGLEEDRERIDTLKKQLSKALSAQRLRPVDEVRESRTRELKLAIEGLAESEEKSRNAAETLAKARESLARQEAAEPEREKARTRVHALEGQREPMEKLEKQTAALAGFEKEHSAISRDVSKLRETQQADQTARDNMRAELKKLEPIASKLEARLAGKEKIESALSLRSRIDKEASVYTRLLKDQRERDKALKQSEELLRKNQYELEGMRDAWHKGQAAVLARDLAPGAPCPVCGSTEHPAPASSEVEIPTEEEFENAETEQKRLKDQVEQARALANKAAQAAASKLAALNEIKTQAGDAADRALKDLKAAAEAAKQAHEEAAAAQRRAIHLREEIEKLETKITERTEELKAKENTLHDVQTKKEVAAATVQNARRSMTEGIASMAELEKAIAAAREKRQAVEKELEDARKAANEAEKDSARLYAALESAQKAHASSERAAAEALGKFKRSLSEAGFPGRADFDEANKNVDRIDAMKAEAEQYGQNLHAAKDRLEKAAARIEGKERPGVDSLRGDFKEAEKSKDEAQERRQALSIRRDNLRKFENQVAAAMKEDAELREEHDAVSLLAGVANGRRDQNPTLMKFQQYVLAALLDDVLASASKRLSILSKSRYALRRVTDPTTGRRSTALDLEVEDAFTGYSRPVQSLSGGESFLASLSLALGLADVVQNYAGGMELGTLFIDEGFGTLDDRCLDDAIGILLDLQKGNKLVGIISHVRELRDCIDVRLEVTPGPRGATAAFVLP